MPTILIVDDDDAVRGILYEVLSEKYECHTASTADEALQFLEVEDYDAILTDIAMPGLNGVQLLKLVQSRAPHTPVILISGKAGEQNLNGLLQEGAFAFVSKPFQLYEIEQVVERALNRESKQT
jgi:two-component system nitrogen regulation response regulator GlnG